MINIEGIDKAELLAALFNNSRPMGMGFLQAHLGPQVMTKEDAEKVMNKGDDHRRDFPEIMARSNRPMLYFDYLFGRPLKVDLSNDEVREDLYDRDNGAGAFARIVAELRNK